jgi:hypothetical protein
VCDNVMCARTARCSSRDPCSGMPVEIGEFLCSGRNAVSVSGEFDVTGDLSEQIWTSDMMVRARGSPFVRHRSPLRQSGVAGSDFAGVARSSVRLASDDCTLLHNLGHYAKFEPFRKVRSLRAVARALPQTLRAGRVDAQAVSLLPDVFRIPQPLERAGVFGGAIRAPCCAHHRRTAGGGVAVHARQHRARLRTAA